MPTDMRWHSARVAALALGLLLMSCGNNSPSGTGPAKPTGLTAMPGNASVALSWTANTESDLAGYDVYQGTVSGTLLKVASVAATATTYAVTGLTNGTTYYFALAAVDHSSRASDSCDEVLATPSEPDTAPPTVAMTQPTPTTGVALTTAVTLAFSEDMDPATVTADFVPSVALATSEWSDGKTLVLQPGAPLGQNTTYTVSVEGDDLAGNALAGTKSFSFTTTNSAPPEVLSTSPADQAPGVPVSANIAFAFSKPMNRASVEGAFSSSPNVTCAWAWSADSMLATCTHLDLAAGAVYAITLGTGATDQAAPPNHLAATKQFSFTTASSPDTVKPFVCPSTGGASPCPSPSATAPANATDAISRSTYIVAQFSEPMDKASAQTAFAVTAPAGHNAGVFGWNAAGDRMTFKPDAAFAYGDDVTWKVSTAAEDLAGNTLASAFTSSFKVVRQGTATLYSQGALDGDLQSYKPAGDLSHCPISQVVGASNTSLQVGYSFGSCSCPGPLLCLPNAIAQSDVARGFLSFDLSSLPANLTSITAAALAAYQSAVAGNPYGALGGSIRAESVNYGSSLTTSAFDVPILQTQHCHLSCVQFVCQWICNMVDEVVTLSDSGSIGWKSASVQEKVADDWTNRASRGNRSQFRLRYPQDGSGVDNQYVNFLSGDSAGSRPYLSIVYEYP